MDNLNTKKTTYDVVIDIISEILLNKISSKGGIYDEKGSNLCKSINSRAS